MKRTPGEDSFWEPAPRGQDQSKSQQADEEYQRIMREIQDREITPDDYDLLLNLEQKGTKESDVSLGHFLAMAFKVEQANINVFSFEEDLQKCAVCFPNYDASLIDDLGDQIEE